VGRRFPCLSVQVIDKVSEVHSRKSTLRIPISVMATNSCGSKKQLNGVQERKSVVRYSEITLKKRVTNIHESAIENGTFLGAKCPIYSPEHEKD
jgi:hypothetical protein